jgi:DNA-binding response OmpR family regulator
MGILDAFSWSRVVVVDDTEASAVLARKVLMRSGLRHVDTILDSRLVMDWIAQNDPDLVLLDLHMPYLDGYAVLERIRAKASSTDLPVIVLTADATADASYRALELDANDFLIKPLNAIELSHRVRTMLDMRHAHRCGFRRSTQHLG